MIPLVLGRVEIHQIVGLSLLVITVISWFVNVIQGNTPDGAPRPKKPKPKPPTARSEIEDLLNELKVDKRKPKPEQREQPPRPPKPPVERARPKPKTTPQRPGGPPPYTSSRQSPKPVEAKLPSVSLGGGIRSHQLGNQIDTEVRKDVGIAVQHDLGNRIAAALPPQERPVHPLIKVLRDPVGVRQAIILNEILQRPSVSRRR